MCNLVDMVETTNGEIARSMAKILWIHNKANEPGYNLN